MRITQFFSSKSRMADSMKYDIIHGYGGIYDAYISPSLNKVRSFNNIRTSYCHNEVECLGIPCKELIVPNKLNKLNNKMYAHYINGTLNVTSKSSHFYSTCAIFEDVETNKRYIIKETYCNTYMCEL